MFDSIPGVKNFCLIQRLAFYGLSIDLFSADNKIRKPFLIGLTFVCNIVYLLAMGQYCWKNAADFNEFLTTIAPLLSLTVNTIKFLVYLKKRKDVAKLVDKIWILTIEAKPDELSIIAKENAKEFIFSLCHYVLAFATCLAVTILPLCLTIVLYLKNKKLQFYFILKTSFDQNQPVNYFVVTCILIGCAYSAGHIQVATDTLYMWLVFNTAAQFQVLKFNLQQVGLCHQDREMYYGIKRCIRRHQRILGIVDEINQFYRIIIFLEILISCVVLCLMVYLLGHIDESIENLPYLITYLMCILLRIIIYCYGGQIIQDESENIADFIYETFTWDSITIRSKKLLLIFIMRAQNCCHLAGYVFIPNFRLFLWIVQTNYSYLSILWSLEEKHLT